MIKNRSGFSLIELMIAITIMLFFGIAFIAFLRFSYEPLYGILDETNKNLMGNDAVAIMTKKIREANNHEITNEGKTLKLDGGAEEYIYEDNKILRKITLEDGEIRSYAIVDNVILQNAYVFKEFKENNRLIEICFAIQSKYKSKLRKINVKTLAFRFN